MTHVSRWKLGRIAKRWTVLVFCLEEIPLITLGSPPLAVHALSAARDQVEARRCQEFPDTMDFVSEVPRLTCWHGGQCFLRRKTIPPGMVLLKYF